MGQDMFKVGLSAKEGRITDDFGGIETDEMPGGFFTQTDVGADDDDGPSCAVGVWVRELFKLL